MDYDTQLINLALDAGEIMLASGAETFRVQIPCSGLSPFPARKK